MKRKVLVIDTSILCVYLGVSGKETCGPATDPWDKARVDELFKRERNNGSIFVLPLATILETGNHISQSKAGSRFSLAKELGKLMIMAADAKSPWAAFTHQKDLWDQDSLKALATKWPPLAAQAFSIGDATIEDVATFYKRMEHPVEIVTADKGLKSREPAPRPLVPRRRQ